VLRVFFIENGNFARLQLAVRQYRHHICQAQRLARVKLETHRARCHILGLQWDRVRPVSCSSPPRKRDTRPRVSTRSLVSPTA